MWGLSPRPNQLVFHFGPGAELGYPTGGGSVTEGGQPTLETQLQAIIDLGADTTSHVESSQDFSEEARMGPEQLKARRLRYYSWLSEDDERLTIPTEQLIRPKINFHDSRFDDQQQDRLVGALVKNWGALSLFDEIGCLRRYLVDPLLIRATLMWSMRPIRISSKGS